MGNLQKLSFLAIISMFMLSCNALVHDRLFTGTVVRDCSGTYVRIAENTDYLVCNTSVLNQIKDGEKVTLVYDFTKKCTENEGKMVCALYHENKGTITVKSIK